MSYPRRAVSHKNRTSNWLVSCFRLLKLLSFGPSVWPTHKFVINSVQLVNKLNFSRGLLSLSYPAIFVHSNCLRSFTRVYALTDRVFFCENLELRTHQSRSVKAQNSTRVYALRTCALGEFHLLHRTPRNYQAVHSKSLSYEAANCLRAGGGEVTIDILGKYTIYLWCSYQETECINALLQPTCFIRFYW